MLAIQRSVEVHLALALVLGPVLLLGTWLAARAGATGALPRNHWLGIRLPWLMASDAAWRAGHRAAVLPSLVWLVVQVAADAVVLVLLATTGPRDAFALGLLVVFLVGLVWITAAASRAAIHEEERW